MKRGVILAAIVFLAATFAGCGIQAVIPAFLLPPSATGTGAQTPGATQSFAGTQELPKGTATPQPTIFQPASPAPVQTPPAETEPYKVIQRYDSTVPVGLTVDLAYTKYVTPMNYFVALKGGWVYSTPDAKAKKIKSFSFSTRLRLDKLVLGADGKSRWYHVMWTDKSGVHGGYVKESAGRGRSFRLDMMFDRVKKLADATDTANTVYVANYKNRKGEAPALTGNPAMDPFGNRRDMSAPAYAESNLKSMFRYAPDGMLGTRLERANGMSKVWFPAFGEARWVPDKYLSKNADSITQLTQVVVVDRLNQNSAAFSYVDGSWKLISMTFVSTGKSDGYHLKTPLGDFMAQERVSKFYYYKDGTQDIEGYAPYAIRFSGGGYLHGVPRKFKFDDAGNRIDPGPAESIYTLGTTPQSHMCVRNYTSYAKFLYDWYKKGQCAVIVFE